MIKTILMSLVLSVLFTNHSFAQETNENDSIRMKLAKLEAKVEIIQNQNESGLDKIGGALFLIFMGIVAGLWAQSTGRNPWLWLMAGVVFSIFTAIAMILKTDYDGKLKKHKEKINS